MHDDPILRPRSYPARHDERSWLARHWIGVLLFLFAAWAFVTLARMDPELGRALDSNSVAEECGVDGNADC